ncbi:hybrid sensor histidine kinase/response regulator transcription factor [Hymenobacter volaticus]|uniref:histidine kinase n=1 Tax=Hymenobacter volaticus TaxID=2932254 RepID=A0ABY4GD76_9BACT|nr:ATP-binding protein [Hymenobacter volaticus]UOQ68741.1 ATP-binding protein [Hymenobacter volaticus]
MNIRCFAVLICCGLLSGLSSLAKPDPKTAVVSASPDSALVHLSFAQVHSDAMQRLGGTRRWRYRPGHTAGWASPATNDLNWLLASTGFLFGEGPPGWRGTGCFRLRFTLDSALLREPLALHILQEGASEVYLDGHLLGRYGTIGHSGSTTRGMHPRYSMLPFMLNEAGPHLLAVRYAKFDFWPPPYGGLALWVAPAKRLLADRLSTARVDAFNLIGFTGSGVLALLHFFLFLFYRPQRANLYFSLFMGVTAATSLAVYFRASFMDEEARWWAQLGFQATMSLSNVLLLAFIYSVCRMRLPWPWLGFQLLVSTAQVGMWLRSPFVNGSQILPVLVPLFLLAWVDMLRVLIRAMRQGLPGIWLVGLGTLGSMLVPISADSLASVFVTAGFYNYAAHQFVIQVCGLVLPICMSIYLARDFAATRRDLEVQLRQVEQLSAQTLAQEAERRQLVSAQNERLEATVQARTEEIIEQNHTLATQRDEISAQADRLRTLDQEKTRFFTNITHEFRTPLTLMLGPAAQITAGTRESATRQQAELIHRNAQRLLHLINQLLDLSRLEAGPQVLHLVPGEVVGFVRGLVGSFESFAQQRGLTYGFEAALSTLYVEFDADKLEKVLINLLSNAFKFTPKGGEVTVQLRAEAAPELDAHSMWVELMVRDTGCGIAPAHMPHVFDRFYQVDSTDTREQEGTGIGLALSKELMVLHGGTITLASEVGQGTRVVVRLPLPLAATSTVPVTAATGPAVEHAQLAASGSMLATALPQAPLLLLIEDNADMRAYLRTILAADYQLLEAENGAAGVALATEQLPDLILTDAMMPRLDGYGVCRTLKQDERTSHIPIVLLTAKADLTSKLHGLDTGADAYLTKPFLRAELLAQLRNLVRSRQQLQEAYRRSLIDLPPSPPSMEQVFLAKVQQVIERFLDDETFSVEILGHELGLSRTQLHRKLKALTDQAPGDFIRLIRMQRAHELLANGAATVSEVAYQVGYSNPANFSTSFSRHFGYAPSSTPRHVKINS